MLGRLHLREEASRSGELQAFPSTSEKAGTGSLAQLRPWDAWPKAPKSTSRGSSVWHTLLTLHSRFYFPQTGPEGHQCGREHLWFICNFLSDLHGLQVTSPRMGEHRGPRGPPHRDERKGKKRQRTSFGPLSQVGDHESQFWSCHLLVKPFLHILPSGTVVQPDQITNRHKNNSELI